MAEYDLLLIGFPIWYGGAPNVVNTFVKGYNLSGKKIAIFATSGGSGIGKSVKKLAPYISDTAEIVDAMLFNGSVGVEELKTCFHKERNNDREYHSFYAKQHSDH